MADELAELAAFDFTLPESSIAQRPAEPRDAARMLVLDRNGSQPPQHSRVGRLSEWLRAGDLLVANRTRVLAARLRGQKRTGGRVEALLLGPIDGKRHRALLRSNGRVRPGLEVAFQTAGEPDCEPLQAVVRAVASGGEVELEFSSPGSPYDAGEPPLPPYIRRDSARDEDRERYQTVFADTPGAVAAPTAGLHLTRPLLAELADAGVAFTTVLLHVGLGTFKPLERQQLETGRLHSERFELPEDAVRAIERTRAHGGRVVAVGTTTARVLETCARLDGALAPCSGATELFLRPGDSFLATDALLTNFHLPRSSLLMLVSAFAGRERILAAYREAIEQGYRFYSYGDAMLIR